MKAPIFRGIIFLFTLRAHGEVSHAGPLAVVWKRPNYRESRAAERTRDKRIKITRIVRIKQLFHALAANRHIRRDRRDRALSLEACLDAEVRFPERGHIFHMSRIDPARKGDCLGKLPRKAVALFSGPLYFNVNSRGSVNYPAGKT
jgi:hypothetical protein